MKYLLIILLVNLCLMSAAQETYSNLFRNEKRLVDDSTYIKLYNGLSKYHPNLLNQCDFDSLLSSLPEFYSDSIVETQAILEIRKVFDFATNNDPHFRILPQPIVISKKTKSKDIKVLPFSLICVNDTLLVSESLSNKILTGARIVSINNIDSKVWLNHTYRDRYINTFYLQIQMHYHFVDMYDIMIEQNGMTFNWRVDGIPLTTFKDRIASGKVESRVVNNVGYYRFDQFHKNDQIIKSINKLISELQKTQGSSLIIDLRRNSGGNGDRFDDLLSIFSPKNSINYQKGVKVKVSDLTSDYGNSKDSVGQLVSVPDKLYHPKVQLKTELYREGVDFYFLVSKDTHSQVATFANIMQYNNFGVLAGESLLKNSLRYGEVTPIRMMNSICIVSTVEYDEYTKAVDGILKPDIEIPYIASEYMQGGDPVLEKLIDIINSTNEKN